MITPPPDFPKWAADFAGTFLLVFTVGCNVLSDSLSGNSIWGGVSIACVLMVSIYALKGISGANFNPAVTFSLVLTDNMEYSRAIPYMLCQMLGGLTGGVCSRSLYGLPTNIGPVNGFDWLSILMCEGIYTMMLCFVVLNVAATPKKQPNEYYGLAIGFVIVAGAYGAGAVSGGCFNPAVAFGMNNWSMKSKWPVIYLLSEFIGAVLAALLYSLIRPESCTGKAPESGRGEAPPKVRLLSEFLGTFMLVLTVSLNIQANSPAAAFSIAASLMCMIYALGDVSGAHFNPAVTIAILCHGQIDISTCGSYVVVQLFAGVAATSTSALLYGTKPSIALGKFSMYSCACAEMAFTAVLCYVVLCVAVSKKTVSETMFGLAIGACIIVGGNAVGAISGGYFNPAVSLGLGEPNEIIIALLYIWFQITGGLLAALGHKITHGDEQPMEASLLDASN